MLVQGFPTVAILRQEMVMLLRVLLKVCGQIVFSQMTDRLLVSDLPVVAFILLGGGTEPLVSPPPLTDALRRGYESVDCDMPDRLNADLLSGGGDVAAGVSSIPDRSLLARDTDLMLER